MSSYTSGSLAVRALLRVVATALPLLLVAPGPRQAPAAEPLQRPNLVVIMADDLGYGDTSVYGGWIETPNLERMARSGTRFTDFHSSGNVCSPTRAGLVTGRYQQRAGIPSVVNADPIKPEHHFGLKTHEVTFAELLRDAGYTTGLFGKWHLGYERKYNPVHHGFDEFRGYVSANIDYVSHLDRMGTYDWWNGLELVAEPGYSTHLITQHALNFIEAHRAQPFCVYVAHEAVHSPYQGPHDPAQRGKDASDEELSRKDVKRAYRQMMEEMDRGVGQILDKLDELGLAENTFVMFFSDNGANRNGSNDPLRGFKGSDWEGGHRVPAVACWPGTIPAGVVSDQLSISLDVMPTMLELARIAAPAGRPLDGASLVGVLTRGETLGKRQLFWNGRAMRDGPWKLMAGVRELDGPGLYRVDKDPAEQTNLAESHPQRVQEMLAALERWRQDVRKGATPQP